MGDSREKFVRSCCGLAGTNHVQARSFGCEKGRGPDPIWKGAPALVIADERSGLGLCSTLQIDARTDPSACRNGGGRDVCCKDRTWKHGNLRSSSFRRGLPIERRARANQIELPPEGSAVKQGPLPGGHPGLRDPSKFEGPDHQ